MLFGACEVGAALRAMRSKRHLTQEQLASLSGFGRSAISEWENGEHVPSLEKLPLLLDSIDATRIERSELAFFLDTPEALYQFGITPRYKTQSVLGEALRGFRLSRGMSQRELAAELSVSSSAVSEWESGAKCPNSVSECKLRKLLDLTIASGEAKLVRRLWKSNSQDDISELLPKLSSADEHNDLLTTLLLFHAARFKWLIDARWLDMMVFCGGQHADLLMSAYRNRELFTFTNSLLLEIDQTTPMSGRLESLHIMRAVALLRLHQSRKQLTTKRIDAFDSLSRNFKTHYVWGRLTTGSLYAALGKRRDIREKIISDPCFAINQQELSAGAQFHLLANLLCDAGKPRKAAKLIESGWDTYWRWADTKVPYMTMLDVAAAKTSRLLGETEASKKHLKDANHKLDQIDDSWRPGSILHVRSRIEVEYLALQH